MLIDGLNQTKTGVKLGDILENTFFEGIGSLADGAIEKLTQAGFVPAFIQSSAIALEKASPVVKRWITERGLTALLATSIGNYANDVPLGIGNAALDSIESVMMGGLKFADNLADDTVGKIVGNITSGPILLGVSALQAGLSDEVTFGEAVVGNIGGMITAAGLTVALSAIGVTFAPISIGAIAVSVAGAMLFNEAYENFEWVKDGTDFVSDKIDEGVAVIGNIFQDSWESIQNWAT